MRKAAILISFLAFGAFGLFAQDGSHLPDIVSRRCRRQRCDAALTANDTAVSAKAKDMSAAFDTIAAFWKAKGQTMP